MVGGGKIPPGIEFDDLVNWGIEGLIKAKNNFKADKNTVFNTYAYYRVRGEMLDKVRSEWQYRNPSDYDNYRKKVRDRIADVAEQSIKESGGKSNEENVKGLIENSAMIYMLSSDDVEIVSEMSGSKNPEVEIIDENKTVLWEEVNNLSMDEKQIIELFYKQEMKQIEIADHLDYSRSKVCRLHMQILDKLRTRLNKRYKE
jgi:RNA polymerase sigma factor FliA